MIRPIKIIFVIILIVVAGFLINRFLQSNQELVQLQFIYWRTKEFALGALVSLSFLLGLLISSGILTSQLVSKTLEARRMRRENDALQRLLETKAQDHSSSSKTSSSET